MIENKGWKNCKCVHPSQKALWASKSAQVVENKGDQNGKWCNRVQKAAEERAVDAVKYAARSLSLNGPFGTQGEQGKRDGGWISQPMIAQECFFVKYITCAVLTSNGKR